jgi:hypothetical protein
MSEKREGKQKGAQTHAEGQHGARAHAHFLEQLHTPTAAMRASGSETRGEIAGRHRLEESRRQHDEAEKNSERNRVASAGDARGPEKDEFDAPGRYVGPDGEP